MTLNESTVEAAALEWLQELGYTVAHGPHLAPGEPAAERESFAEVVLVERLRAAIERLNRHSRRSAGGGAAQSAAGGDALADADQPRFLSAAAGWGAGRIPSGDGSIAGDHVRLVDFAQAQNNDWLAVNQFTVIEGQHNRRPDLVVFLNGLPLGVLELKKRGEGKRGHLGRVPAAADLQGEIPSLLHYNAVLVISDGLEARLGSVTANQEWFKVWRTIDGEDDAPKTALELAVLLRGVFEPQRFLSLLQHFIAFEEDPDSGALHKILAGYHQFHAVNAAVEETVRASGMGASSHTHGGKPGDRRAGVVWHTQGSGKSFSMLFFAARVVRHPAMQNPTLVVLTDRNDLDDQLFGQFQRCADVLGQTPVQARDREHLRELLAVASGGVIFTTIQKFLPAKGMTMPALSKRQNIVVIADEAHRTSTT
jgi:type I restriction enzyme R subunit